MINFINHGSELVKAAGYVCTCPAKSFVFGDCCLQIPSRHRARMAKLDLKREDRSAGTDAPSHKRLVNSAALQGLADLIFIDSTNFCAQ